MGPILWEYGHKVLKHNKLGLEQENQKCCVNTGCPSVYVYVITFPKSFSSPSFQSEKWWKSFGKYFVIFLL